MLEARQERGLMIAATARIAKKGGAWLVPSQSGIVRNGIAEPVHLENRKALRSLVAQHFGFDLPELETMRVDAVPGWQ